MDPKAFTQHQDLAALGDLIDAFFGISPELEAQMEKNIIEEHNHLVDAGKAPPETRVYFH